ncbi:MAG TPA: UvrD-helicase domain-containing protein [Casimicrobiaceae bacterium]|nr:UvrD-helicase domain-containing protein [Casimicrobiaceae bacterium]
MNEAALDDTRARGDALDPTRSFIVQAPAGSGKTELLIQRYLALLARVERPEAIVAITFTRKAAGEIRERIVAALREPHPPADATPNRLLTARLARAALERDAAADWHLVAHPARLHIHTIDALCMALVRRAPLAAKQGALPRPVERADALYAEAARDELYSAADDDAWRRLLDHLDNDAERAVQLIAGLLAKREQWLRYLVNHDAEQLRARLEHALEAEIAAELGELEALLPPRLRAALAQSLQYAARNIAAGRTEHPLSACAGTPGLPPANAEGLAQWRAIAGWLLTAGGKLRVSVNVNDGFPPDGRSEKRTMEDLLDALGRIDGFEKALQTVKTLPPPHYEDDAWSFIQALTVVLPRTAARLSLAFARHGVMDFNQATLVALEALASDGAPSDLLLALDARIEHLLVDEFQDTSFAQCELIGRLTAGWSAGDGRTLFLVGDPMQSIYRFRDADVRLFLEARARRRIGGVALEPLTLSSNFRAQRGLVDWLNGSFPGVLAPRDDPVRGAVAFAGTVAARRERFDGGVTLDLASDDRGEAQAAVGRVRAALAAGARSVAVLVRKRADLAEILPALRAAGIAFAAVELDRLSERQAVLDLAALTHALVQPDDRAAWLAVLRAPWCGLTLPDLFVLLDACGHRPLVEAVAGSLVQDAFSRLTVEGRARLERFAAAVLPALRERGRAPVASRVRSTWLALGGPACVTEPAVDLAAAEQVFALIAERAHGADLPDWPGFVAALEALYAQSDIPSTPVQVMTLHKAKGLEFDAVIMPGLARSTGGGDAQLLLWRERPDGLLLAPLRARTRARERDDPVYAYLRALAADEDDAELRRLLYVGCTRARTTLHLCAVLGVDRDAEGAVRWRTARRGTLLAALWPALTPLVPAPATGDEAQPPRRLSGVPLERLPVAWRLPGPPPGIPVGPESPAHGEDETIEFDWAREAARRVGIVAHRILRRMADEGFERWTRQRIDTERPRIEAELAHAGFTGPEARAAVDDVVAALERTIADPRGRWLFDPRHAEGHSEYALTEWRDGAYEHRVLDRTFVDASGTRWIVDFKLSRHEGGDLEAFLDRERERYATQLQDYATMLRALDPRPIRLALYFPLLAGWREWAA